MPTEDARKTESVSDHGRSLPGHDIFKTPENPSFYSANIYTSPDTSKREIRLIELSIHADDGMIECKLLPATSLSDLRNRYFALSYCAGDPSHTRSISVNGVRCNVFANLHHALGLAHRNWIQSSRQGPLLLWIDQLCINQHDLKERSHQVGFMIDIYQYAESTLACLSTSETDGRGMKWLIDLCDAVPFREEDDRFRYEIEEESDAEDETKPQHNLAGKNKIRTI